MLKPEIHTKCTSPD